MPNSVRSIFVMVMACVTFGLAAAWQSSGPAATPKRELLPALDGKGPRYWKGNLHTHSLWSDGDDFPEMIADWYKQHGYNFLTLSDHNILSDGTRWLELGKGRGDTRLALQKYEARFGNHWVERRTHNGKDQVRLKPLAEFRSLLEGTGRFLLIPGEEITHQFAKNPVHLNAINIRDAIQPVNGASVAETIQVNHRVALEQGRTGWNSLVSLNHPNYQWGVKAEDIISAEELRFFEIYNGIPNIRNYGDALHPGCERMWDIVLALRLGKHHLPPLYGLATDDAHGYHAFGPGKDNPGRGWVMVRRYLSAEAIVRAMQAGDFYASTGVSLRDIRRENGRLTISIAAEPRVSYRTQFIATMRDASLASEPRQDSNKKPIDVTRVYGEDVGKIVAEVEGTEPAFKFSGQELYVRAKVISTKLHPNPHQKGDVEVAWVQPENP